MDLASRVQKFVDCRTKDASRREARLIVEGDSAMGAVKAERHKGVPDPSCPSAARSYQNCLKADYAIFKSEITTI